MSESFKQLVENAIAALEPRPAIVASEVFPTFDDAIVVLHDGNVRWRLIRERTDVALQAASLRNPDEWYDAAFVEALSFGSADPEPTGYPQRTLDSAIAQLVKLRPAIQQSFGSDWAATRQALREAVDQ